MSFKLFTINEKSLSNFKKLKSELVKEPEWSNLRNIQTGGARGDELENEQLEEIFTHQELPIGWNNNLFHSNNGEYNGYLSKDNNFYYTKHFQTPVKTGLFNNETGVLTIIIDDATTTIQLYNNVLDIIEINQTMMNGALLEGGKTRKWVKSNGVIVVKSNSSDGEYECNCKSYILGIPVNPPLGYLNLPNDDNVIIEKMITKNSHTDDFIKCYYDKSLYEILKNQYNVLIEKLKTANIGGDFKLDNILFNNDGMFILTDFSISMCPSWEHWTEIAIREEGSMEPFINFKNRLISYINSLNYEGKLIYVPIRKTTETDEFIKSLHE